jgi:cytochrome c oxidase subunit 2
MRKESFIISAFHPFSPEAVAISHLFILVLIVCLVILAAVVGIIAVSLFRFRHRPDSKEPAAYFGNRKLEIIWTVIPTLIVIWLFVLTAQGMHQSDPDAIQPPDLVVTGHQWWWEVRYTQSGAVTANEIHIPVGRKLLVRLESADVIHNFWVPALARKIQMIPGQTNHVWLEASTPGTYRGTCAEYCGAGHAWMLFSVIAEPPAQFDVWERNQARSAAPPAPDAAQNGLRVFQKLKDGDVQILTEPLPISRK